MTSDRLDDGKRIAQLLASELDGRGGTLADVSVTDADPDVEPTADGAFAYAVTVGGGGSRDESEENDRRDERIAEVYVQPDRVRIEFLAGQEAAVEAAGDAGLRVRPKASRPPRTLVFVEDGAEVKRAVPAVTAGLDAGG